MKSNAPLANHKNVINKIKISSIEKVELFSLAIPIDGEKKAKTALAKVIKCKMPSPGNCVVSVEQKLKILRLAPEQALLYFSNQNLPQIQKTLQALKKSFYITEQSDAWSGTRVSGQQVIACLERICPIDLSYDSFGINCFARTSMEHLNTIIIRNKRTEFELFSGSSSAKSFLHAIETSAQNI